ncbi:MAG TPA: hypothetical protein DDX37_03285 [Candidatus Omnitrophica bacterium]|nr:hypothetical protein [Candidatus Omnitrophota bacterium]
MKNFHDLKFTARKEIKQKSTCPIDLKMLEFIWYLLFGIWFLIFDISDLGFITCCLLIFGLYPIIYCLQIAVMRILRIVQKNN